MQEVHAKCQGEVIPQTLRQPVSVAVYGTGEWPPLRRYGWRFA
jgi:hypothetical protein